MDPSDGSLSYAGSFPALSGLSVILDFTLVPSAPSPSSDGRSDVPHPPQKPLSTETNSIAYFQQLVLSGIYKYALFAAKPAHQIQERQGV